MAQQRGLHSEARRRGRAAVRKLYEKGACAMSLADELVLNKVNETEAIAIGQDRPPLFKRILAAGVKPAELHASPLDGITEE